MSGQVNNQEPEFVVIPTEVYKDVLAYLTQMPFNQVNNLVTSLSQSVRAYEEPKVDLAEPAEIPIKKSRKSSKEDK